ncbi:MAG: OmpA family protein [Rhodocyclaceae bacterium]|nr:OmpA family protein [Rhodocyclaceae bacterium]
MSRPTPPAAAVLCLAGALMLAATVSSAGATDELPYLIDTSGQPARNGSALCWRTGSWSPAAARSARFEDKPMACTCEPELVARGDCEPPPAVPPAPPPTPLAEQPMAAPAVREIVGPTKVKLSAEAHFRFGTSVLQPDTRARLDQLTDELAGIELEVVLAVGHADRIGDDRYNQEISEKRAAEVKAYLIGRGVPANRIYTEGKGEKQPVHLGDCDGLGREHRRNQPLIDCLAADRRVEIEAIGVR